MIPLALFIFSCITLLSQAFTVVVPTSRRFGLQWNEGLTVRPPSASTAGSRNKIVGQMAEDSNSGDEIVWSDATILSNEKACPSGKSVLIQVQVPTSAKTDYKIPGQFLQLRLDESTEPLFLAMCSPPGQGSFQFLVKTTTSTDTSWLSNIKPDTAVQVTPVMGNGFPLKEKLSTDIEEVLLIAAGSGIAPFKACAESGLLEGVSSRVYYGEWTVDDLSFRDEFSKWEDKGLKVIPALSRAGNDGDKLYAQEAAKRDGIKDPERTLALLCGMNEMVEAAKDMLQKAGVPESQILTNF